MEKQIISKKSAQIQKASSTLFAVVVVASIVVSFSGVFINLLWSQSRFNAKVINEREKVRDDLKSSLDALPKLKAELQTLESADDLLKNQGDKTNSAVVLDALPSKYDFPAVATSFAALAEKTGVKLDSFSGDDVSKTAAASMADPKPVEIPFKISVSGNYQNVVKFIDSLEKSIRPIIVQSFNLSGDAKELELEASLSTYYQPAVDLNVKKRTIQ